MRESHRWFIWRYLQAFQESIFSRHQKYPRLCGRCRCKACILYQIASALLDLVLCLHFLPSHFNYSRKKSRLWTSNLTALKFGKCVFSSDTFTFSTWRIFSRCRTVLLVANSRVVQNLRFFKTSLSSKFPFESQTTCSHPISADGHYSSHGHHGNHPIQSPECGRCLRRTCALSLKETLPPLCYKKNK